eukprot:1025011-Rhodomonas_salina.1
MQCNSSDMGHSAESMQCSSSDMAGPYAQVLVLANKCEQRDRASMEEVPLPLAFYLRYLEPRPQTPDPRPQTPAPRP